MFNQLVRNVSEVSTIVPDFTSIIDGSFKLRLRNMRLRKGFALKVAVCYDNRIVIKMENMFNFRRIKYADRIGVTYWASAKYDPTRTVAPVSFYALLEGPVPTLHQQAAVLGGTLEAPQTAWSQEIDCLNTFVASSSRKKIVGQYIALSSDCELKFPQTFKFEMPDEQWASQEAFETELLFAENEIETEWKQIVSEEKVSGSPKKARRKRSKTGNRKAISSSKDKNRDSIEFSSASNRKSSKRSLPSKVRVTA